MTEVRPFRGGQDRHELRGWAVGKFLFLFIYVATAVAARRFINFIVILMYVTFSWEINCLLWLRTTYIMGLVYAYVVAVERAEWSLLYRFDTHVLTVGLHAIKRCLIIIIFFFFSAVTFVEWLMNLMDLAIRLIPLKWKLLSHTAKTLISSPSQLNYSGNLPKYCPAFRRILWRQCASSDILIWVKMFSYYSYTNWPMINRPISRAKLSVLFHFSFFFFFSSDQISLLTRPSHAIHFRAVPTARYNFNWNRRYPVQYVPQVKSFPPFVLSSNK